MMDYNNGRGGPRLPGASDFSAMPRIVQSKYRFKDPYG